MLMDKSFEFAKAVAVSTAGAVGDIVDLGTDGSAYDGLFVIAKVESDFSAGTLGINIETADNPAFTDARTLLTGTAFADLARGKILLKQRLPFGVKRYLRAVATGADMDGGTVSIDMALDVDKSADGVEK